MCVCLSVRDGLSCWSNGPVKTPKSVARQWSGSISSSGDSKQHRLCYHVTVHDCCLLFCSLASVSGAGVYGADGRWLAVTRSTEKQMKLKACAEPSTVMLLMVKQLDQSRLMITTVL